MNLQTARVLCRHVLATAVLLAGGAETTLAQARSIWLEAGAGWTGFVDDARIDSATAVAGGRVAITPRLSVGPELVYFHGDRRRHLALTGNIVFDVLPARGAPRLTPFVVAGLGLFQTREDFQTGPFTSSEPAFTTGGGLRVPIGRRVDAAIDARIGWEPHLRVTGGLSVRLTD